MDRQVLRRTFGEDKNFFTITEIASVLDVDRSTIRYMMNGTDYISMGKKKLFHINDIVSKLLERKKVM